MMLRVLNTNLTAIANISTYESLIWTERFNKCGDFAVYQPITKKVPWYIKQEYFLVKENSDRAMIIEEIEITSDVETGDHIKISGRSLESILDRRIIWGQKSFSGNLQNGIKTMLEENIINPKEEKRKISNFVFKESADPRITKLTFEAQYKCENLLEVIEKLCGDYDIGFRITLNDELQFVFELYAGEDRSYDQFDNPCVVFSSKFKNIINSNYLTSSSDYKNVTLVVGEGEADACMTVTVGDENVSGLARRELFSDASDISQGNETAEYSEGTVEEPKFRGVQLSPGGGSYEEEEVHYESRGDYIVVETPSKGIYDIVPIDSSSFSLRSGSVSAEDENSVMTASETTSNEPLTDEEYKELLIERGTEKLLEHKYTITFDGKFDTTKTYKYGESFFIGDIVQFVNEYGHEAKVRVVEYITSIDEQGISAYPSFAAMANENDT